MLHWIAVWAVEFKFHASCKILERVEDALLRGVSLKTYIWTKGSMSTCYLWSWLEKAELD